MQQQQHGGGAAQQFGVEMPPPFSPPGQRISAPEAPSPISSRLPAQQFDELAGAVSGGGFDAEGLAAAAAGEEGGSAGNRWPRQETLALLKIRQDMDAAFRDAALKGPLWEQVSRKLAEQGYSRSAKKCKEKFENVHKYYKRTKKSRAGRNDGKAYRFFTQLEALHGGSPAVTSFAPPLTAVSGPMPVRAPAEPPPPGMMSFSTSNTEDYSDEDDSDDEGTQETGDERGKRKRASPEQGGGGRKKMMRFFEGLMRQVMERQEAMQQRFLEAIEKREQDRMIREEAWRRQEMARLAREQEILAQERAMAASRDAAVLSFIQKITGQTVPMPSIAAPAINVMPPPAAPAAPPPPAASQTPPPPQQQQQQQQQPPHPSPQQKSSAAAPTKNPSPASDIVVMTPAAETSTPGGSSRWPKAEVHALIQLRSNLDTRYQEVGPKGPLWEEISAGMRRLGYNRSSKRCKEKWENINKYFKKVKESNKKRPEDSKTCPYFHQLDALYRNKALMITSSSSNSPAHAHASASQETVTVTAAAPISQTPPPPPHQTSSQAQHAAKNGNGNGSVAAASNKQKTEDMMKEMMEQRQQQVAASSFNRIDGADSDNMDDDDEYDDDEEDEDDVDGNKMQYEIQFQQQQQQQQPQHHQQHQNAGRPNGGGGGNPAGSAAPSTPATTTGSFLGMVQ